MSSLKLIFLSIGLSLGGALPATAAVFALTLTESDFGFPGTFPTLDPGAIYTGFVDVPAHTSSPGGEFAINDFELTIDDPSGIPVLLNQMTAGFPGDPMVTNDGSGNPEFLTNPTSVNSDVFDWSIPIPIMTAPPGTVSYGVNFNSISGVGNGGPASNFGTWVLFSNVWDGSSVSPGGIYRYGSYELSPIPEPSRMLLVLIGFSPLLLRHRR